MTTVRARAVADAAELLKRFDGDLRLLVEGIAGQYEAHAAQPAGQDEALPQQLKERDAQIEELRTMLVKARMEAQAVRSDLSAERQSADNVRANAAEMRREFEKAIEEMRRDHAAALVEQQAASVAMPLDELLAVFAAMDKADTAQELLTALLEGLAREFSRVAIFNVDGPRLVAAQRLGFGDADTSKSIRLPADSILTRAVRSGRLESVLPTLREDRRTSLPFSGSPACAIAVPVALQGAIAAVIYADDSDHVEFATGAPQVRLKFAEILQQYAALVLVRMSVVRKSTEDLRSLAATLVAEIEYAYTVEAEAGRTRPECQQRLKDALQKARRRYAEQVGSDTNAATLFDEQLAATLMAKKESAFARDLATLLGPGRQRGGNIVAMFR